MTEPATNLVSDWQQMVIWDAIIGKYLFGDPAQVNLDSEQVEATRQNVFCLYLDLEIDVGLNVYLNIQAQHINARYDDPSGICDQ